MRDYRPRSAGIASGCWWTSWWLFASGYWWTSWWLFACRRRRGRGRLDHRSLSKPVTTVGGRSRSIAIGCTSNWYLHNTARCRASCKRAGLCFVGLAMLLLLVPLLFLWWTEPPTAPPTTAAMTTTAPMIKIAIHFLVLHHGTSLCGYDSRISFDASAASA